jgi:hypothetical protein
LLREMRTETNMVTHRRRASEWLDFARRKRVCPAIRDRVAQAYSDVAIAIANGDAAGPLRSAAPATARAGRPSLRLIDGGLSGGVRK